MKQIWKYTLGVTDGLQRIDMPDRASFLHAADQDGLITMWFVVDVPPKVSSPRWFRVVGTGHQWSEDNVLAYVGTVQLPPFVWHILEETNAQTD